MKNRIITVGLLTFSVVIVTLSLMSWHIEKIDYFIRVTVEEMSEKHLPVNIFPGSTTIQILPPSLQVSNVKVNPKKELANKIKPFEIKSITVRPSLLNLIFGKLWLASVNIDGADINANLEITKSGKKQKIVLDKILRQIPLTHLNLKNIALNLQINDQNKKYQIATTRFSTSITNEINHVLTKASADKVSFNMDSKKIVEQVSLSTQFFLTNKNLVLSHLSLRDEKSTITLSGNSRHNMAKEKVHKANINLEVDTNFRVLEKYYDLFKKEGEKNPIIPLHGHLSVNAQVEATSIKNYTLYTRAKLFEFAYENFKLGGLALEGAYNSGEKRAYVKSAGLTSPGADATVNSFEIDLEKLTFNNAQVNVHRYQLAPFLKYAINEDIPANARAEGMVNCSGAFEPFEITCPGKLAASNLEVGTANGKQLVKFKELNGTGSVKINAKEVSYEATAKSPKSKGKSQGVINYKTGFKISYEASYFDFSELGSIADLTLEGSAKLTGKTEGDSKAATFDMNIESKDLIFEDYQLGSLSTNLRYKSGNLFLDRIQGAMTSSRYLGDLKVNLDEDRIYGKIQFPFIDLAVVKESVKEHLDIPVELTGSGSAIVSINSPLDAKKLSFQVKSRLYNCTVEDQHIDTADINVNSELGKVNFSNSVLEEKKSKLIINGNLNLNDKTYNLNYSSDQLFLSDLYYTRTFGAPTSGIFKVDGSVAGTFEKPEVTANFESPDFKLSGQPLHPIRGRTIVNEKQQVLDIDGPNDIQLRYKNVSEQPTFLVEGKMQNVNLAPILASVLELDVTEDYKIQSSNSFSLKVNKNNIQKVNGYIFLTKLEFIFTKSIIKNNESISLFFTDGKMNFSPFKISGTDDYIEVKSSTKSLKPIDLEINGLFKLSFLQIFTPFLETLEGLTSVNLNIQSDYNNTKFVGSAFIDDAFIKLPNIEHSIEELKVDILFNQDRLIINSMKGRFANGSLVGDGTIKLGGKKNIVTDISVLLESVNLNIPEQVKTRGNAELKLTGNWLPLTLSGTYEINGGMITKEISGAETANLSPHEVLLPPALLEKVTSPILLDLKILPQVPIDVNNSMLEGKIQGKMSVSGDPESPIFGGNLQILRYSDLKFKEITFKVNDSNIVFNQKNPPDPSIYLLAETRYREYDIEMQVQGTASKPRFKLSSQPTLTEPEIISLLTLGYTNQDLDTSNNQGAQSSLEIGTGLLSQNPLGKEFKNRFGFDIQFSSSFDEETSVAVPKISISRPISDKMSVTVSRQTGAGSRTDAKVRYDLRRDLSATLSFEQGNIDDLNQINGNATASDILGIDMEYRMEFE